MGKPIGHLLKCWAAGCSFDAFDFPLPTEEQRPKALKFFNFVASRFGNSPRQDFCVEGIDGVIRPPELEKARNHILSIEGVSPIELRQDVEAYSAKVWGARRADVSLPEILHKYIDKVTQNAYKVLDRDIEELKNNGYSEDTIFEVTIACALGAALASVEAICDVYIPV